MQEEKEKQEKLQQKKEREEMKSGLGGQCTQKFHNASNVWSKHDG